MNAILVQNPSVNPQLLRNTLLLILEKNRINVQLVLNRSQILQNFLDIYAFIQEKSPINAILVLNHFLNHHILIGTFIPTS